MISQQELAEKLGITRSSVAVHISNLMKKGCIAGKGYVLRSGSYAVVVGGVNVDIGGRSFAPLVEADSNPGVVTTSLGGVGRNIAHNMSLLGLDVRLLTAYGDDLHGQQAAAVCSQQGIDLSPRPAGSRRHHLHLPVSGGPGWGDGAGGVRHGHLRENHPRISCLPPVGTGQRPGGGGGCQHPRPVPGLSGGEPDGAPVCGPGVHRQGGEAPPDSLQNPHPEAQPAGSRAALRGWRFTAGRMR